MSFNEIQACTHSSVQTGMHMYIEIKFSINRQQRQYSDYDTSLPLSSVFLLPLSFLLLSHSYSPFSFLSLLSPPPLSLSSLSRPALCPLCLLIFTCSLFHSCLPLLNVCPCLSLSMCLCLFLNICKTFREKGNVCVQYLIMFIFVSCLCVWYTV